MKTDLILGFTGGKETKDRAEAILSYCDNHYKNLNMVPPIIVSGECSGMRAIRPRQPEAIAMRDYLVEKGIPDKKVLVEERALDGISSIVYSLLLAKSEKIPYRRIAFVTSSIAVERVQNYFQLIIGKRQQSIPLPHKEVPLKDRIIERLVFIATKHDLEHLIKQGTVTTGDLQSFDENYLHTSHPFCGKEPHLWESWYGQGVIGLRTIQKILKVTNISNHY